MRELAYLHSLHDLPRAYDPKRAARGRADISALASAKNPESAFLRALLKDPRGPTLLDALFGNSPFLGQIALAEPGFLQTALTLGPDASMAQILEEIKAAAQTAANAEELMRPLRLAKRRSALAIAIADLGGMWTLSQITAALSNLAEASVAAALSRLWQDAADHAGANAVEDGGLVVLALGKLGARELNYSSDIDLMVLWDQEKIAGGGKRGPQEHFVRLTTQLVKLLQTRTADGYVFRVDLRLRPDPGATPIALSMAAAENYYESFGQNWERAAMIKARPVAGDLAAGQAFLARLSPFIWRKHLDFAAVEDIHSIKRQIHAHKGHAQVTVPGHNIKLGRGGIREIEFFAQTQQLIAGGRDRRLRSPATCDAIRALAETGRLQARVADELIADYKALRRIEHRLQMINDEQTQTLPETKDGLAHLAVFLGQANAQALTRALTAVLKRVEGHYAHLFERAPTLGGAGNLVFTGVEDDPETLKSLLGLGFREPSKVAAIIRGWHHGRYRAMRSERAREKLTAIMPELLAALAKTADPDAAFLRFDEFLGRLPAGIQVFSLFDANRPLLQIIANVMGTAPRLAEYLAHRPLAFDGLLAADFTLPLPAADVLRAELGRELDLASDFQEVLDTVRRWVGERRVRVGLQLLQNLIDGEQAGMALADLASAALGALLPSVERDFASRHGRVKGGAIAIVGMGRLGGREMTLESDLDLILIYDHPPEAEASDGKKPLSPGQYFTRLSQGMINAVTAPTAEGRLYEVDMRLRPSGNAGPIAASIDAFQRYQESEAWTWEHMALTRARVIAGSDALKSRIEKIIRATLTRPRDGAKLRADAMEMRARIAQEHGSANPWSVKQVRGGLVDIEFISQTLQLHFAALDGGVLARRTLDALHRLAQAGYLAPAIAAELTAAAKLEGDVLQLTRICQREAFVAETAPMGLKAALAHMAGAINFKELESRLLQTEARVRGHYAVLIEGAAPGGGDPAKSPAKRKAVKPKIAKPKIAKPKIAKPKGAKPKAAREKRAR